MMHHNSNVVLLSILSNSILHKDTCIKASKVSIALCFGNSLSQIAILEKMTSMFLPKFREMWPTGTLLVDGPPKLPCLVQWFVFTFMHESFYKLKQFGSTCIAFNHHQSKFMINLSNHWFHIVIRTSPSLG